MTAGAVLQAGGRGLDQWPLYAAYVGARLHFSGSARSTHAGGHLFDRYSGLMARGRAAYGRRDERGNVREPSTVHTSPIAMGIPIEPDLVNARLQLSLNALCSRPPSDHEDSGRENGRDHDPDPNPPREDRPHRVRSEPPSWKLAETWADRPQHGSEICGMATHFEMQGAEAEAVGAQCACARDPLRNPKLPRGMANLPRLCNASSLREAS
jgi:hypothetical protein